MSETIWGDIEREWTEYLDEYEMSDGNVGSYTPTDEERGIAIDALAGFLAEDNTLSRLVNEAQKARLSKASQQQGSTQDTQSEGSNV